MIRIRARKVGWLAALVALALCALPAPADVLILADGKAVEGEVADRGETYEVKTRYGTLTIKKSDVKQIIKGSEAAAPAPPAEPAAPTMPEKPPTPPAPSVTELAPPVAPPSLKPGPVTPLEAKPVKDPAVAEVEARKFIEELFGAELKRVAATADGKDDVALAKQLLQTAKTIEDQPVVAALLCEKAVELGAKHAEGLQVVEESVAILSDKAPERAGAAQEKLLALYRQRFNAERDVKAKVAAGEKYVDAVLTFVEKRESAGDYEACIAPLRDAATVATAIRSESSHGRIKDALEHLTARSQAAAQIKRLKAQVEKEPGNQAIRKQLVMALLVDHDDPAEAAKHAEGLEDAALKKHIRLEAKGAEGAEGLTEAESLELGDWYRTLAEGAAKGGKAAMYGRARDWYGRYLEVHAAKDLNRAKVELAMGKVEAELDRLGGVPAARRGGAVSLRLPRKTGLVYQYGAGARGGALPPSRILLSPDCKYLAASYAEGIVHVWDVETGKDPRQIQCEGTPFRFSPDGRHLAVGGRGVRLYDVHSGRKLWDPDDLRSWAYNADGVHFRADGKALMMPRGGHVALFDAATGKVLAQHANPGNVICFAPDGRAFYAYGHAVLTAHDFTSGKELWKAQVGYSGTSGMGLHITPDGNTLLTNRHTGEGVLVDARSGRIVFTFSESILKDALPGAGRCALCFSQGGYVVAAGGSPDKSAFFDARSGRRISVIDVPRQSAVSPDGRFVAASKSPKTILLFEIKTGKTHELECPARNEGHNTVFAWTPDGKYLFSSGGYGIGLFGVGPWR